MAKDKSNRYNNYIKSKYLIISSNTLSHPTLLRVSEARLTGASSNGGKCAESPPTFIERKTLEKPKETGHQEYSRFGSYLYV